MKFFLKLIVSLFFVVWLIFRIDWEQAVSYIAKISLWQVVLYVAVLLSAMAISAVKWQILAQFKGFRVSLKRCFELYLAGTFINNFMPSFIGGDTYKAYQLGKKDKKYVSSATTVVVDRVTGLLGAMILSVIFGILNWRAVSEHRILVIILSMVFLLLIVFACMEAVAGFSFWKKISSFAPKKILEIIRDFAEYKNDKWTLLSSMLLAIVFNLVGLAVANYVLFWGFGINVGILDYLTVIFLISIVSALPISINNIGIKEWAYVTFFGFFGVSAPAVVAVALVSRILQMIISFAALPTYLKNRE